MMKILNFRWYGDTRNTMKIKYAMNRTSFSNEKHFVKPLVDYKIKLRHKCFCKSVWSGSLRPFPTEQTAVNCCGGSMMMIIRDINVTESEKYTFPSQRNAFSRTREILA